MSSIAPPGLSTTTTAAASPGVPGALGKEEFLKLLVAQLSHQDPLSPLQGTEFVAQLAQFSSLEQLVNLSDRVSALALAQTAAIGSQAVGFVGRSVTARGDRFRAGEPGGVSLGVELAGDAAAVKLTVLDSTGKVVATRDLGALAKGRRTLSFDGKDMNGNPLPAGEYTFRVEPTDAAGKTVEAVPLVRGTVDAVSYASGVPTLKVGGLEVPLAVVLEVGS
jgi:flagellar basal-body rod modification protein FlgD